MLISWHHLQTTKLETKVINRQNFKIFLISHSICFVIISLIFLFNPRIDEFTLYNKLLLIALFYIIPPAYIIGFMYMLYQLNRYIQIEITSTLFFIFPLIASLIMLFSDEDISIKIFVILFLESIIAPSFYIRLIESKNYKKKE